MAEVVFDKFLGKIREADEGSGDGTSYENLKNKPSINGVTLEGDMTSEDLGIATSQQGGYADTSIQSLSTPLSPDGTITATKANGDTITIDLNHQHPNYYSKVAETTQPSGGMLPDVTYKLGTLTGATTFSFAAAVSGNVNHYYFTFNSGSTAVVPTWPASITSWDGNCVDSTTGLPVIAANKTYEVSVLDGNAIIKEW